MKKFLSVVLAGVCAVSAAVFGFSACGSSKDSDVLTSLEEWEAVLDGSNYSNFTADVTYSTSRSYYYYFKNSNGNVSEDKRSESGTEAGAIKYDLTYDTYLTGNIEKLYSYQNAESYSYQYDSETVQDEDSEESTFSYYTMLAEDYYRTASKYGDDGEWHTLNVDSSSRYFEQLLYTTAYYPSTISDTDYTLELGDSLTINCSYGGGGYNINTLLTADYTGIDLENNYIPGTTAAEYKDGAYTGRVTIPDILDEDVMVSIVNTVGDNYTYETYFDYYVKVNDGHISYVKVEYTYSLKYDDASYGKYEDIETCTMEYNLYDFGTTSVTVPDEVNALFAQ